MKTITCPSKEVPVIAETQVLVVGSGPAGISAAVASARCGAKTMLVERYGCFGGALSVGQVESYTWYFNKNTYTAQGISKEIEDRMIKIGGVQDDDRGCGHFLNPEKYKYMLDCWIQEEGITPLLHTLVVDVIMEGKTVKGVIVENKSGRGAILADRIVDATGDGDVAALAGAAYEKGENNNGKVLPVTMVFGVSGVDTKTFRDYIESHPEMTNPDTHGLKLPFRRAKADGKWPVERDGGAWKELTPTGEFTSLNLTLENGIDGTNVWDLTHAEIQGRQQVMWAVDVLRNYAKEMGFANCSLRSIAGQIATLSFHNVWIMALFHEFEDSDNPDHPTTNLSGSKSSRTRASTGLTGSPTFLSNNRMQRKLMSMPSSRMRTGTRSRIAFTTRLS